MLAAARTAASTPLTVHFGRVSCSRLHAFLRCVGNRRGDFHRPSFSRKAQGEGESATAKDPTPTYISNLAKTSGIVRHHHERPTDRSAPRLPARQIGRAHV